MTVTKLFKPSLLMLLFAAIFPTLVSGAVLGQDLAPPTDRDVWEISNQELEFLNNFSPSPRGFLISLYAQYLGRSGEVLTDSWNVARATWSINGLTVTDLGLFPVPLPLPPSKSGKQKPPRLQTSGKPRPSQISTDSPLRLVGVAPMIFLDTAGVSTHRYTYEYLGVEQLGNFRTWTFMLKPKESAGPGAFSGRIWVVDHDIVRFKGTFVNPAPHEKGSYISFDSVRFKAPNGHWLPWRTYLDETGLPPSAADRALRARLTVWGFNSRAAGFLGTVGIRLDENVDSAHVAGAQLSSEDVYLEAEQNLVQWLGGEGIMALPGKFERDVCDPIIQDIILANHITLDRTLSCRLLLTVPAETVLFESVIGVSIGVFDLSPNAATVAALIAREVALAQIRSAHLDLAWGRPDTLTLRDERDLINLLLITPSQIERDQADDLALQYLAHLKGYKRQDLETAAIFLYTASEACKTRPALFAPRFGDGLPGCGREAHISRMSRAAPPGSDADPGMYIGSRTDVNPWDDTVTLITAQKEHAAFRVIPEPMLPVVAPDDPDPEPEGLVQPSPIRHLPPPPALLVSKTKGARQ